MAAEGDRVAGARSKGVPADGGEDRGGGVANRDTGEMLFSTPLRTGLSCLGDELQHKIVELSFNNL